MALTDIYTPKQIEIFKATRSRDWKTLINYGAQRSGKTILDNDLFLNELRTVRKMADADGVRTPQYILAGYTLSNIQDNVLNELTNKYGIEFRFDKYNNFTLFGVKVVQCAHGSIKGLGSIRGMTAYGAYVNEASLAVKDVFIEIKARCSAGLGRLIADTNPGHPEHWLKKDFIDNPKAEGTMSFHFTLTDNTFLTDRYIKDQIQTTPTGMFFDRNIKGLWVSGDGVVYKDFDKSTMVIKKGLPEYDYIIAGVDWGWEHWGAIVVVGVKDACYDVIEEHSSQYTPIDQWVNVAVDICKRYGDIPFYCDSARPDNIWEFVDNNINAISANKNVMPGVEAVATLMKNNRFRTIYGPRFKEEIYSYVWNKLGSAPESLNDDVLDAIRYAIYSDIQIQKMDNASYEDIIKTFKEVA